MDLSDPHPMDSQLARLVDKTWSRYLSLPPTRRHLIAIAGIPGSGKTTLAARLVSQLNRLARARSSSSTSPSPATTSTTTNNTEKAKQDKEGVPGAEGRHGAAEEIAVHIPMDGYHLLRSALSALPNADEAHARRGAPFTFDADGWLALVRQLGEDVLLPPPTTATSTSTAAADPPGTVYAPAFSHAAKDPVPAAIRIPPTARVLVLEGNYVGLAHPPPALPTTPIAVSPAWGAAARAVDEVWWVEVSERTAEERLWQRHVAAGIVADEAGGRRRAVENDLPNGRVAVEGRGARGGGGRGTGEVSEWVVSVEEGDWAEGGAG